MEQTPLLKVNNIEVIYEHIILVLKGVSLEVPSGGIVSLLGANGAGKTTTLKAISNLVKAERGEVTKGTVEFEGKRIDKMYAPTVVKMGLIQIMEGRRTFEHLSVEDDLLTGAYTRGHDTKGIKESPGNGLQLLSAPCRKAQCQDRIYLRRRDADVCHRQSPDGQAQINAVG